MIYEIAGLTAIIINTALKKDYSLKEKILETGFNFFLYFGFYNLSKQNSEAFKAYLFSTPIIFSLATITDYLKIREEENHKKLLKEKYIRLEERLE